MGIFGIFLVILIFVLLLYFVLKLLAKRFLRCSKVRNSLEDKLFYNVWIRYIIEGYLQTTHNSLFYLTILASFWEGSLNHLANILVRVAQIVIFSVWPFLVTVFLLKRRKVLDEPSFQRKYISIYSGLNTKQM